MSANKKSLGRGLDILLSSTVKSANKDAAAITSSLGKNDALKPLSFSGKTIISLPVADIAPNPRQPRKHFAEDALQDLAQSIKIYGVIQPLIVRRRGDKYELVAGERRLRASRLAGIDTVPAIVKDMSDEISLKQAIIENVQRENLNALEEAESYALLIREFNLTQEQVARQIGKARSSVANALRLNELPREVKESLRKDEITAGHARAILAAGDVTAQIRVWTNILKEGWSVRSAEKAVAKKTNKPAITEKSTQLSDIEQKLSSKLATKVELSGTEQKGVISIKYFSRDELDRLYVLLADNKVI